MTTDYKVTGFFCIIDEFCKHFDAENAGNLLEDNSGVKRRRRAASLSDSEIMTILLYFHFGTFRNFKHYYLFFIKGTMKSYFPKAVSYNRFVELESRVFFQLMFFLNLGAFGRCTGITFVDSTMIPVCHNLRRYANKVFKGIATDGKGTMGWCHGFKLHLACNDRGEIIAFVLTGAIMKGHTHKQAYPSKKCHFTIFLIRSIISDWFFVESTHVPSGSNTLK